LANGQDNFNERIARQEQRFRTQRANEEHAAQERDEREREEAQRQRDLLEQRRHLVARVRRTLDAAGYPGPAMRLHRVRRLWDPRLPFAVRWFDAWPIALYYKERECLVIAMRRRGDLVLGSVEFHKNVPKQPGIDLLCQSIGSHVARYELGGYHSPPYGLRFFTNSAQLAMQAEERLESDVVDLMAYLRLRLAD
jgi:hypothetical protein